MVTVLLSVILLNNRDLNRLVLSGLMSIYARKSSYTNVCRAKQLIGRFSNGINNISHNLKRRLIYSLLTL